MAPFNAPRSAQHSCAAESAGTSYVMYRRPFTRASRLVSSLRPQQGRRERAMPPHAAGGTAAVPPNDRDPAMPQPPTSIWGKIKYYFTGEPERDAG